MIRGLSLRSVLTLMQQLIDFPFPAVCRHYAVGMLLDALEREGWVPATTTLMDLAHGVVAGSNGDVEVLGLLAKELQSLRDVKEETR